jgi:hypothetical protein
MKPLVASVFSGFETPCYRNIQIGKFYLLAHTINFNLVRSRYEVVFSFCDYYMQPWTPEHRMEGMHTGTC